MRLRFIPLALAAAATFVAPAVAVAAPEQTATTGVRYKDLDLNTEAGQKELEARLDKAAREVCGMDDISTGTRVSSRGARDCYRDARQQLGDQVSRLAKADAAG